MQLPRFEEFDVLGPKQREVLRRVCRARQKEMSQNIEWHLWPLVMSGVPAEQLTLVYVSNVFVGVSLNGELVIESVQP